jgi:arylsulfatase A-like enzyme
MIFSWPGHLPQGRVRDDLCELIDFGPTLMNLAGLDRSMVEAFGSRGRDLFDDRQPAPQAVFGQINMPDAAAPLYRRIFGDKNHGPMRVGVRTRRHRLDVSYMEHGRRLPCDDGNLIDMQADPGETRNLFHDAAHRPTRDHLLRPIDNWFAGMDKSADLFADTAATDAPR